MWYWAFAYPKELTWKYYPHHLGWTSFEQYFYQMGREAGRKELLAIQESSFIKIGQPSPTQASPKEAAPIISWFWLDKVRLKDSSFQLALLFSLGVILLGGVECTVLFLHLFSLVAQVREFMGERRRTSRFFSIPFP